jgi:methylenetetrahydrofolate dehydrogenase (NADP+)/methenyltetrahydrofolate cyclohydrolase
MKTIYFDGKKVAREIENEVRAKVVALAKKGIKPKLTTIIPDRYQPALKYTQIKETACERVGIEFEVYKIAIGKDNLFVVNLIKSLGKDKSIDGLMIQLPLPDRRKVYNLEMILSAIDSKKDVDGLKKVSKFAHPTSLAILRALKVGEKATGINAKKVAVVGAKGMVGAKTVKLLSNNNYEVIKVDRESGFKEAVNADAIVSATGRTNVVGAKYVKEGVILLDVGYPNPEFSPETIKKASFVTPVPGGIGPLTVAFLLENLLKAAYNRQ